MPIDNLIQQWKYFFGNKAIRGVYLSYLGKIEKKSFSPKLTDYFIQGVRKMNLPMTR